MSAIIVEDDPDDLVIFGKALHHLGLEVTSASTVAHAKQLLIANLGKRSQPFGIAFVDINLIGSLGDGIDVLRDFRQISRAMPVVMVTGSDDPKVLGQLLRHHYVSIAFKPVEIETIKLILDQHRISYANRPFEHH